MQATDRDQELTRYPVRFIGGPWDGRTVPLTAEMLTVHRVTVSEGVSTWIYILRQTKDGYGYTGSLGGYIA